ncbi:addiction module antidote protein [Ochrobactrum sp. 3-3]|uniref:addiction module antidote protein n=1 Tax=Ochrobactrum sp. 3-3 TaxID=1830124 RepID=UPI000DEF27DE|nr:addiction module antidote protein [Ochrobactrum sp. 3-3]
MLPFDVAEYLTSRNAQAELLADAFESGDETYIKNALATIACARGMTALAKDAAVTRQALYKSLSETGDPRLSTLIGVIKALGFKITVHETAY